MKVRVFSIDEVEERPDTEEVTETDTENVIPLFSIDPEDSIDTCKLLWEGELEYAPEEGDTFIIEDAEGNQNQSFVTQRIFHVSGKDSNLTLFTTSDEVVFELEENE